MTGQVISCGHEGCPRNSCRCGNCCCWVEIGMILPELQAPIPHPEWPCKTPECPGDGRYAPPGRGHRDGCTTLTQATPERVKSPLDVLADKWQWKAWMDVLPNSLGIEKKIGVAQAVTDWLRAYAEEHR